MKIPSDSILNLNLDLLRPDSRGSVLGESQSGKSSVFSEASPVESVIDYAPSDGDYGEKILDMEHSSEFLKANGKLIAADGSFKGEYSTKIVAMFILEPLGL